jgi:hypothetical protein
MIGSMIVREDRKKYRLGEPKYRVASSVAMSNSRCVVSVVVPLYNIEKYIAG